MEDDEIKNKILLVLHKIPDALSIQRNVLEPLNIQLDTSRIMMIRKQLVIEGLITERDPKDIQSLIEITPEGYYAVDVFEDYHSYKLHKKQGVALQREVDVLNMKYLRLKTVSIVMTIVATIISFISGVLLSTPIKEWLHKL